MLKRTLTAEEHAAFAPEMQALYVAAADGNGFTLEVDPDPAVRTLQTQIGEFRENNVTLTRQMEELRRSRQPAPENAALEERVADLTRIVTEEREATKRERTARAEDRFQIRVAELGSKAACVRKRSTTWFPVQRRQAFASRTAGPWLPSRETWRSCRSAIHPCG